MMQSSQMIGQKAHSPEQLLALLEAAIGAAPAFVYDETLTEKDIRWLGRAEALLEASDAMRELMNFRFARADLGSYSHSRVKLLIPLNDAYCRIELMAPSASQGAFIPPGDTWNGYASLIKIIQTECDDLLIVDPYLSSAIYTDFAPHSAARKVSRFLTEQRPQLHPALIASAGKWSSDPISQTHPVELRYSHAGALHDRLIIVDKNEVWLISQSFKDIAKRSPASVSRADSEIAFMKAQHYDDVWLQSEPQS